MRLRGATWLECASALVLVVAVLLGLRVLGNPYDPFSFPGCLVAAVRDVLTALVLGVLVLSAARGFGPLPPTATAAGELAD